MDTTCPIYVSAIDKKTGKAFVKQVDVPYRRPLKIESYLSYYYSDIEYISWSCDYDNTLNIVDIANIGTNCFGKILKCKQCGEYYYVSNFNIYWYKKNKMNPPKRCKSCRNANRKSCQEVLN